MWVVRAGDTLPGWNNPGNDGDGPGKIVTGQLGGVAHRALMPEAINSVLSSAGIIRQNSRMR